MLFPVAITLCSFILVQGLNELGFADATKLCKKAFPKLKGVTGDMTEIPEFPNVNGCWYNCYNNSEPLANTTGIVPNGYTCYNGTSSQGKPLHNLCLGGNCQDIHSIEQCEILFGDKLDHIEGSKCRLSCFGNGDRLDRIPPDGYVCGWKKGKISTVCKNGECHKVAN